LWGTLRAASQAGIDLSIVERDGETVVTVGGDLDGDGAWRIRECLAELVGGEPRRVVLDVAAVYLSDFLAVSVLIGALTESRGSTEVELRPPHCRTYRILLRAGAPGAHHDR
jgi:anti-anti-sigma regulatory factor